jgi:ARG/rhodanese/phosphatase superfamily protein
MPLRLEVGPPVDAGALRLFPLFSSAPPAPPYLCGPEAEAAGVLHVGEREEGAQVPHLTVAIAGAVPVLLVEGEILLGALQNRTLNVSVLCAAPADTVIPVSCVEAGRWGAPKRTTRSPRHAPPRLRGAKTASVADSLRAGVGHFSDQGEVWRLVDSYDIAHGVNSATSSLEDVAEAVAPDVRYLVANFRPEEGQVGVVAAAGGGVLTLDCFDKPATLAAYWDGLLSGYALDAVGADPPSAGPAEVEAFLARLLEAAVTEAPGTGLGTELHLDGEAVTGAALVWEGAAVHLAAFDRTAE